MKDAIKPEKTVPCCSDMHRCNGTALWENRRKSTTRWTFPTLSTIYTERCGESCVVSLGHRLIISHTQLDIMFKILYAPRMENVLHLSLGEFEGIPW